MGAEVSGLEPEPHGMGFDELADALVSEPLSAETATLRKGPEHRAYLASGKSINEDIRAVFDRMLAAEPQRTVIAPEREWH